MKNTAKVSNGFFVVLEDSVSCNDLIKVYTSKKRKKEMIQMIRGNIQSWTSNPLLNSLKDKLLDLAIVVYCDKHRYKRQDVDNIAKIILDALKTKLYTDDNQIIRLLLEKKERTDVEEADSDEICISIREHNPKKQMILTFKNEF